MHGETIQGRILIKEIRYLNTFLCEFLGLADADLLGVAISFLSNLRSGGEFIGPDSISNGKSFSLSLS